MKKSFLFLFSLLLLTGRTHAQGSDLAAVVKDQARKMATALVKGDYPTFVHYMNPTLVKMSGGAAKMTEQMNAMMTEMLKSQKMKFGPIKLGEVSKILPTGKELQCTIPQESEIVVPQGTVVTKSTLVAISADGGKNWTFLDTNKKDAAAVRQLLPNLNPGIVIVPSTQAMK